MRYNVGQKVWTIGLDLVSKKTGETTYPFSFRAPHPEQYSIAQIFFNELTVTEHHKVPGEWDNEKKYDGFILIDGQNRVWHNQYPRAIYGQLSDSSDDLFTTPLLKQLLIDNKSKGIDAGWDGLCKQFADIYKTPTHHYSLTRFMDDLAGGILDDDNTINNEREAIWPQLKDIRDRVVKEFFEATGKTLEPYIWHLGIEDKKVAFRRWRVVD